MTATTDANGAFSYVGLGPGRYEVQYRVGGEVVSTSGPFDLAAGAMQVNGVTLGRQRPVVRSFRDLGPRMEPGTEVSVIDIEGNEIIADLLEVSSSTLTVSVDGARRDFLESQVLQVSRPPHGHSRVWGGFIGFGTGLGIVAGIAGACTLGGDDACGHRTSSRGNLGSVSRGFDSVPSNPLPLARSSRFSSTGAST